jgi:hypothetical protein
VHGVIFASFAGFVSATYGGATARSVLGDEPVYLTSENYPDEVFMALLTRTCEVTGVSRNELERNFGVFAAQTTFAHLYPAFFSIAGSTRNFLLTVEDRIHELVRATIPNATPPQLRVEPLGEEGVHIEYTSPRRLCLLLRGLVEGTAAHYEERAETVETSCMHRGDRACLFEVRLSPLAD